MPKAQDIRRAKDLRSLNPHQIFAVNGDSYIAVVINALHGIGHRHAERRGAVFKRGAAGTLNLLRLYHGARAVRDGDILTLCRQHSVPDRRGTGTAAYRQNTRLGNTEPFNFRMNPVKALLFGHNHKLAYLSTCCTRGKCSYKNRYAVYLGKYFVGTAILTELPAQTTTALTVLLIHPPRPNIKTKNQNLLRISSNISEVSVSSAAFSSEHRILFVSINIFLSLVESP